jgi:hypothetical protein
LAGGRILTSVPPIFFRNPTGGVVRVKKGTPSLKRGRFQKRKPAESSRAKQNKPSPIKVVDQLWVKHPPKGEWPIEDMKRLPNGYVTIMDFPSVPQAVEHGVFVETPTKEFHKTRSAFAGMKAFVGAYHHGLYPDIFVLEWLTKIFEQYGESEGKISLEDLLGIRNKKGPKTDVFSQRKKQVRDHQLCLHMCILIQGFGLGAKEAAPAVAAAFKDHTEGIQSLTAGEIAKRFGRVAWKAFRKSYAKSPIHKHWPEINRRTYLLQYPISALPPRLHHLMQASS